MHRRALLFTALLPALSACESLQRRDQASRLTPSVRGYASTIRWGNLDTAYGFLRPRDGTPQPSPNLESLKVTGYDIRVISVNEESDEALVSIAFTYYFQDTGRVDTVEQTATWYFDTETEAWVMDEDSLPDFR